MVIIGYDFDQRYDDMLHYQEHGPNLSGHSMWLVTVKFDSGLEYEGKLRSSRQEAEKVMLRVARMNHKKIYGNDGVTISIECVSLEER